MPEWTEGCTPVNNLDQKLMKLRHDDLEQLKAQAVKLREEATSAEDVVKELKVYLETLRQIFVEVGINTFPSNYSLNPLRSVLYTI